MELVPTHQISAGTEEVSEALAIQLRSFSDVLYYVAQGIEAPAEHRERGLTKTYTDARGRAVDRRALTADLLDVRCAALRPAGSFVAVRYRGCRYYIDDADPASKDAFALLSIVFALQSKERPGGQPVLTIPVSG